MSDQQEDCQCEECIPGLPAWMGTFADLMSLLMCFFVLLLSFSEMDVLKFKRLAGSMREAFGVQNQIDVNSIPKGTSIIAQEFSPGKPDPTPLQTVMQQTTDADQQTLEVLCEAEVEKAVAEVCEVKDQPTDGEPVQVIVAQMIQEMKDEAESKAVDIADKLQDEVAEEVIEIETKGRKIVIRVQEKGSFSSGSARLQSDFIPILEKLIDILSGIEGQIVVEGHSDDVPIKTARFPSNWHLSSARALEVATNLFLTGEIEESRFAVSGYADTRPLVPNDTPENRAKNRRVEIILQEKSDEDVKQEVIDAREAAEQGIKQGRRPVFELDPAEIF